MEEAFPCTCPRKVRLILLFSFILTNLKLASSTAQVPLVIWSNRSLPVAAPSPAGHILSSDGLNSYLGSAFGPGAHTVLFFLQDELSVDDFTVFGGVFGNERDGAFANLRASLRDSASSLTFPAVACSASSTLAMLERRLGVPPTLVDADSLARARLETKIGNLLVVELASCASSQKSCKEVLRDNDAIISDVTGVMATKMLPYTAMYTGVRPSRVSSAHQWERLANDGAARSLLQAPPPEVTAPIMFNGTGGPCIMLWAQNLNVSFSPSPQWTDLAAQTPSLAGSRCGADSALLVLQYSSGISLSFAMSQRFYPTSARNWFKLDSVQLSSNGTTATFTGHRAISAPSEYSFRCQTVANFGDALLTLNSSDPAFADWRLRFVDFQIQGFGLANGTDFSYASDCAGFFTPGIWMGTLTSLLMLSILVYGLHMITQLNTMDRFDDPKGPSISVPQSE
ncbi:V-type proton ATPase subunit S1-like [Stigmatopora nigra]